MHPEPIEIRNFILSLHKKENVEGIGCLLIILHSIFFKFQTTKFTEPLTNNEIEIKVNMYWIVASIEISLKLEVIEDGRDNFSKLF